MRRALPLLLLLTGCTLGGTGGAGGGEDPLRLAEPTTAAEGLVVDLSGSPVAGAEVSTAAGEAVTGVDGRFTVPVADGPGLVSVRSEGHLPRVEVSSPGRPLLSRLTPRAGGTVSLRFGGDVMAGRRFYDRDEDGRATDALLPQGAGTAEHVALLEDVRPLLESADLTVVNLESPLSQEAWFDPTGPRPPAFQQTKEFVFASAPELATALAEVGVDVVDLGNNHLYDLQAEGVASTLAALDDAGLARYGAGPDLDAAWEPARVEAEGTRFSFVGCTTVTGEEDATPYVATPARAGAAPCDEQRLRDVVAAEAAAGQTVVASVHGGSEYSRQQSRTVRRLQDAAREAGALLVVDHHPHVVGGVQAAPDGVVAETLGNLLFDQEVWPTYPGYLLTTDVQPGRVVRARTEPIVLEGYLPTPVTGRLADATSRIAAGLLPGSGTWAPGGAELLPGGPVAEGRASVALAPDRVRLLEPGWRAGAPSGAGLQVGEELLWTGDVEDATTSRTDGAHLWDLSSPNVAARPDAAHTGRLGFRLGTPPAASAPTLLTTRNRVLLDSPRRALTLSAWARGTRGARLTAELHWYDDTRGPSSQVQAVPVALTGDWSELRLEAEPPPGTVAVQVFLRLAPSATGSEEAVALDDVALVQWAPDGTGPSARYGAVRARGGASEVPFVARQPAGGTRLAGWVCGSPLRPLGQEPSC